MFRERKASAEGTLLPWLESWWDEAHIPGDEKEMIAYAADIEHPEAEFRTNIKWL